jgi:hypothetical protein
MEEEAKKKVSLLEQLKKEGKLLRKIFASARRNGIKLKEVKDPEMEIQGFTALSFDYPVASETLEGVDLQIDTFMQSAREILAQNQQKPVLPYYFDDDDPVIVLGNHKNAFW